jgi:hypothetical protein
MSFRVFGETSSGRALQPSSHDTAHEALAEAVELMSRSLVNVRIVDADGRHFTPVELAQNMSDPPAETETFDG